MMRPLALVLAALLAGCRVEESADVGVDASTSDAPSCLCDDGIDCTRDRCDERGACVHEGDCENGWCAALPDGNTRCESRACESPSDCRGDLPCAAPVGCVDGFCRYDWAVDRDNDGELDRGCGGNDCQPTDRGIPAREVCNFIDDDCDGMIDNDIALSDLSGQFNCGACGQRCSEGLVCTDGVCGCGGYTECDGRCLDTRFDSLNCGSCGHRCFVSACESGRCPSDPTTAHGVDRPTYTPDRDVPPLGVSANGDMLFQVVLRPTRLFHWDRASELIPAGESPFPLHAVRLDQNGDLISVTSLPQFASQLAVTDEGFYFAGVTSSEVDFAGRHFMPFVLVVGFVRRGDSEIAWAHALTGNGVTVMLGLSNSTLAMVVSGSSAGERNALRLIGPDGVVIALPMPTELGVYDDVTTLLPSPEGGFLAFPSLHTDSLPRTLLPGLAGERFAIRHDSLGHRVEAIQFGTARLLTERADGDAWIVQRDRSIIEFARDGSSRTLITFTDGWWEPREVEVAVYDGPSFAYGGLTRVRRGATAESYYGSTAPHLANLSGDVVMWTLNTPPQTSPLLPGARSFVYRFDMRPLP